MEIIYEPIRRFPAPTHDRFRDWDNERCCSKCHRAARYTAYTCGGKVPYYYLCDPHASRLWGDPYFSVKAIR